MAEKPRVGIAFQGGGFPAGAIGAGVVHRLIDEDAFDEHDVVVFSGTSAGALVASVCWGYSLLGTLDKAPQTLQRQWMHHAWSLVPNATVAQLSQLADSVARLNPLYHYCAEYMVVPLMRDIMIQWVETYIPVEEFVDARDHQPEGPGLILGSADVLRGEIKTFTEKDFCLDAVLASGSLAEINGVTIIEAGPHQGVYCDGAWATNPPISPMMDYQIDQLWLVEIFPQIRATIPRSPGQRRDRKDELWQNSLVQHELYHIEKVNEWLESGRLNNQDGKFRHVTIKKMSMDLDLPAGAAFVNSPYFIQQMMDYGYEHAPVFLN